MAGGSFTAPNGNSHDAISCRTHCRAISGANYFSLNVAYGCSCKSSASGRKAEVGTVSGEVSCTGKIQGSRYLQSDYVGFNTGNGGKLSYSQAEPGQLLDCSLVSLHFRC